MGYNFLIGICESTTPSFSSSELVKDVYLLTYPRVLGVQQTKNTQGN